MFTADSIRYYDDIYNAIGKDYAKEADTLRVLIEAHRRSTGTRLLDVACGTGGHIPFLRRHYDVQGLDVEPDMVAYARQRHPDTEFTVGDMRDFDLGQQFNVVLCLFSSIGYMRGVDELRQAVANMARHLEPGGVLIVEPWLTPEAYRPGGVHATFVDKPDVKLVRMNRSEVVDGTSVMDFHYLIGTPDAGIEHVVERHVLSLFTHNEYMAAFADAGLETSYDPKGLIGRGLYIGIRPNA